MMLRTILPDDLNVTFRLSRKFVLAESTIAVPLARLCGRPRKLRSAKAPSSTIVCVPDTPKYFAKMATKGCGGAVVRARSFGSYASQPGISALFAEVS